MGGLFRPDRAGSRVRSRQHDHPRPRHRRRLSAERREDVDHQLADCRRVRGLGQGRRRADSRLRARKRHEGSVGAEDRGQVQPACLDHRRDRHGLGVRSAGKPAARGERTQGAVRLPQQGALRHRLGRDGCGGVLLAGRTGLHPGPQAVRPAARGQPAHPEKAGRHADRDHPGPARRIEGGTPDGRGHGRAGNDLAHQAQQLRQGPGHRPRCA